MASPGGWNHGRTRGRRSIKDTSISVESLENRALLTALPLWYPPVTSTPATPAATAPVAPPAPTATAMSTVIAPVAITATRGPLHAPTGRVSKAPHFYEAYTGPRHAELNAVRASGELSATTGNFTFTGTDQGRINAAPATFVWGIDRNGNLPPGTSFINRPNIKFDAVVVVTLDASHTLSAKVMDLVTGAITNLPAGDATVRGATVSVTVPSSLLPSTGLAPSQYRFNYWPEDGGPPVSASVASFLPETTTAQVGTTR